MPHNSPNIPAFLYRALFLLLFATVTFAQSKSPAKPPKPDLHAGGFDPSSIPNGAVTEVTLPGYYLTGARVETGSICKLVSYTVVSDNEIKMRLKGVRPIDELDGRCTVTIRTSGGTASSWIAIDLTDEEQAQQDDHLRAAERAKAAQFISRSGKSWRLTFAGGASETFTSTGDKDDAMPDFQSSNGNSAKIAVSNDNTVLIVEEACIRSGKLSGNEVKNGQSRGECAPPGSWIATVTR